MDSPRNHSSPLSAPAETLPATMARQRSLRRAPNLLTPRGQPSHHLQQSLENINEFGSPVNFSGRRLGNFQLPSRPPKHTRSYSTGSLAAAFSERVKQVGESIRRSGSFRSRHRHHAESLPATLGIAGEEGEGTGPRSKAHKRSRSEVSHGGRPTIVLSSESSTSLALVDTDHEHHHHHHHHHRQHHRREADDDAEGEEAIAYDDGPPLSPLPPIMSDARPQMSAERGAPIAQAAVPSDFTIPRLLQQGTPMTKVSQKKQRRVVFRLDPDQGQIIWESKKHRIIPIENIRELRTGVDARYNREQLQLAKEYESRWITIIYTLENEWKTLHAIAPSTEVFQMWDRTLRQLYDVRKTLMAGAGPVALRETLWERQYWKSADEGADQKLYFDDVEKLCKRLNINPSREDLMRPFQQADVRQRGFLDFADFQRFVKLLKSRPEIDRIYKRLAAAEGGQFTYSVFEQFVRRLQKSAKDDTEIKQLFLRYASYPTAGCQTSAPLQNPLDLALTDEPMAPSRSSTQPQSSRADLPDFNFSDATLSLDAFTAFLLSPDNSPFSDPPGQVIHDMSRPISEYYISSSHNTYLVGNQITGETTVEGYIRALLHSCRSVELDIYDGESEPFVYHGKTLTKRVFLRDICQAINKYAFAVSPYPIIISAEVHCSIPQQEMIVNIMHQAFGDALVSAPYEGRPKIEVLPSPEELKYRVLLKAKNLFVVDKEGVVHPKEITVDAESSSTTTTTTATEDEDENLVSEIKEEFHKARNILTRRRSKRRAAPDPRRSPSKLKGEVKQKVRMSMALTSLLVYTVGVKCRGLNKKEQYAPEHVFSLSENALNKMFKQDGTMADLIKHCRTHVVRVYPKGMRVNSTNYEPHRYWSAGCQLVAINWQTCDLGYMINHAMFQRNGRSGYVLKPAALRSPDKERLLRRTKHFLDITVISAQQLPLPKSKDGHEIVDKSIIDPFVEVSVHVPDWMHSSGNIPGTNALLAGEPSQAVANVLATSATSPPKVVSYRTSTVKNNGFNPVWEEELSLPFDVVGDMRELVFIRFAVYEAGRDDDEPLAVYCVPLGSLREGFRHLPLHDSQLSQYLFSTLFVQISVRNL